MNSCICIPASFEVSEGLVHQHGADRYMTSGRPAVFGSGR